MAAGIDHLVLCVHDLETARSRYARFGFTLTPPARHPFGTGNSLVQLQESFLELLAVVAADRVPPMLPGRFSFAAFNRDFLEEGEGCSMLVFASDVNALGLQTAQGLSLTETWYWDMNDANRAWTKRWSQERNASGKFPTMIHAGVYSGILHFLKARVAMGPGPHDGKSVVEKMKSMPTDDVLFGKGEIRVDGRKTHPVYLFEVKKPEESKYPGDIYKVRATIPVDQAWRPLKEDNCPLVKG